MSDVDPTPATQTTIGDRLSWMRGDAAAQNAAQLAQLAQLVAQLAGLAGDPPGNLADVAAALYSQTNPRYPWLSSVASSLTDLQTELGAANTDIIAALYSQTNPRYPWLSSIASNVIGIESSIDNLQDTLGARGSGSTIYNLLDNIYMQSVNTNNLLSQMLTALSVMTSGVPPALNVGDISSFDSIVGEGRRFAKFSPPIAGVSIDESGFLITATSWAGWQTYVKTTSPSVEIGTTDSYPPNTWTHIYEVGTISISVEDQYPITAYLRAPSSVVSYITTDIRIISGRRRAWFASLSPNTLAYLSGNWNGWHFRAWDANNAIVSSTLRAYCHRTGYPDVEYLYPNPISSITTDTVIINDTTSPAFVKAELYKP